MSASLTAALIWGLVTSISVMNAEPVLLVVLLVGGGAARGRARRTTADQFAPTVPLRLATVPLAGETSIAACKFVHSRLEPQLSISDLGVGCVKISRCRPSEGLRSRGRCGLNRSLVSGPPCSGPTASVAPC